MSAWVPLASSQLKEMSYDEDRQILSIRFQSGGVYDYSSVPKEEVEGLLGAASAGRYFHAHIKDTYMNRRVG